MPMNFIKTKDPYAAREAEKYSDPIPSREYILSILKDQKDKIISRRKLEELLLLQDPTQREALRRRIQAMRRDGQLLLKKGKGYYLPKDAIFLKGTVLGTKDGFGFLEPEDKSANIFLSAYQMRQVFPKDRVLVRIISESSRARREASIVEILERNTENMLGRCVSSGEDTLKVISVSPRIHQVITIPSGYQANAVLNQIVLVEIIKQPDLYHPPTGRITKVLGDTGSPGIASLIAIYQNQLPYEWSQNIEKEIEDLKVASPASSNPTSERIDLRHLPFMTIDGENSKDFDDAVYCQREKKNWKLWVAIADVSHYVKPDTLIDQEAQLRGNSVYFPDRVVPMLPDILSNDWCSLKPNVDRFCLVCEMIITQQGKLKEYQFYPAIIESKARLTYTLASQYLSTQNYSQAHQSIADSLNHLENLHSILNQARQKRGSIDFDLKETNIILNTQGNIESILASSRTIAHRIIEECMLIANVAAAQFLINKNLPSLFRIHESPAPEKVLELQTFLKSLGYKNTFRKQAKSKDYAKFLQEIQEDPKVHIIHMMVLRVMNQAVYSPINRGHFGLAYLEYTHFTSPIRRYSDLIVHRSIHYILSKKTDTKPIKKYHYDIRTLERLGAHCSMTERRADEATRAVVNQLKCQYIKHYIGESFQGTISHIVGFGLFIALQNQIEGLIHISHLNDDHYVFDSKQMRLKGQNSHKTYQLGDQLCVQVAHVNTEAGEIDFRLCNTTESKG